MLEYSVKWSSVILFSETCHNAKSVIVCFYDYPDVKTKSNTNNNDNSDNSDNRDNNTNNNDNTNTYNTNTNNDNSDNDNSDNDNNDNDNSDNNDNENSNNTNNNDIVCVIRTAFSSKWCGYACVSLLDFRNSLIILAVVHSGPSDLCVSIAMSMV